MPELHSRFGYSAVSAFEQCPKRYKMQYIDGIATLPSDDPANALILGTALHLGIETDVETAVDWYLNSYPIITDAHVNEEIKLRYWIPVVKQFLPPGIHETPVIDENFIGTLDYLAPVADDTYDLYDFKYSNNWLRYQHSRQLHLYKYYYEKTHPGKHIRKMYFLFIPKIQIRQKKTEELYQFRRRLRSELEKAELRVEEVQYDQQMVIDHLELTQKIMQCQDFPENTSKLCDYCQYKTYCMEEYTETLNLFTVSMGQYAEEAYNYAQKVSAVLGIDPAEWVKNQGAFNSIIIGFGVAGDKAAYMSKNLTQLAYDLSSFYNISVTDAFQKVQSGIAGELEPLRRLGYDLSVARLEQERLNLGVETSVNNMTQAEKSQLRYYAMMTQVTQVQGDMARTLQSPANMLRVLQMQLNLVAREIGNLFIPILRATLPPLIAVASAIREVIAAIAGLFGITPQTPDWGDSFEQIGGIGDVGEDFEDAMGGAADSAKEIKNYLAGFDELNVLPSPNESAGGGAGGIGGGGGGFDLELPGYDFLKNAVTEEIDKWKQKLEPFAKWITENLDIIKDAAIGIGGAFAGWAISRTVIDAVSGISSALSKLFGLAGGAGFLAIAGLLADVNRFVNAINDIAKNGANFSNVTSAVSELMGIAGDFSVLAGYTGIGGALKVVQGIGEIVSAIADMKTEGINWKNASDCLPTLYGG